ncbi:hypothetical protein Slala05_45680 [Streptomyces lavendulae subsp. lavendulae]|nr:hypothetical protein Slala05_45680 [Streptomyces lavendulae subsp. lavendulae]
MVAGSPYTRAASCCSGPLCSPRHNEGDALPIPPIMVSPPGLRSDPVAVYDPDVPPAPPGLLTGQERTWLRKAHIERGEDPVRLVAIDSRGDRYVQVLLCDDGTYGLEHRAGTGSEHCRSRSLPGRGAQHPARLGGRRD